MAQSGDIYREIEGIKHQAADLFAALENDDNLADVVSGLGALGDRIFETRSVISEVNESLGRLGLVKPSKG